MVEKFEIPVINSIDDKLRNKDLIIDYFMIIGLDKQYYNEQHLSNINSLKKKHPSVLSRFPNDRERYPFNQNTINSIIIKNIFPLKKLDFVIDPSINDKESNDESIYKEYIIESQEPPKQIFHIFSVINQSSSNINESYKHFACLIVFEDVTGLIKEKRGMKIFVAKALILTSIYPYYSLYKTILEKILSNLRSESKYPIELLIFNIIATLEKPLIKKLELRILNYEPITVNPQSLLPICDVNLLKFFNLFSLDDFFLIAERHLYMENIYFYSSDLSLLYPTCFTFLSLLFPLNFSSNYYYPILITEGPKYKTFLFEPCLPMILLINGKFDDELMMKNFSVKGKPMNFLIVDIDRKKIKEISYNKKYSLISKDKLMEKQHIPKFKDYNLDIYNEISSYLNNYNNKNKNCSYFDKLSPDQDKEVIYIRQNFFTFFIKIINFYVNCVNFNVNKNLELSSYFNKSNFIHISKQKFPGKEIFYENIYSSNLPLSCMIDKNIQSYLEEKDIKNFILMDELIKLSLNKNVIYFDIQYFQLSYESKLNILIDEAFLDKHSENLEVKSYLNHSTNNIQMSMTKDNDKLIFKYHFIPNLISDPENDKLIISKTFLFDEKEKRRNETFLIYELSIVYILIEKSFITYSFDDYIIFSYILILAIQINSIMDEDIIKRKITIIMKLLRERECKINFVYSLLYDIICENDMIYEKEFFDILVEKKITPSLYLYILNKNKKKREKLNNNNLNKSLSENEKLLKNICKKMTFEIVHDCELLSNSKNLYEYFTKYTLHNSTVYFDCFCKENDIHFKCSIDDEVYPLIGGPINYLRQIILIILNNNSFIYDLNTLNTRNKHILLSIAFYSLVLNLNHSEILYYSNRNSN